MIKSNKKRMAYGVQHEDQANRTKDHPLSRFIKLNIGQDTCPGVFPGEFSDYYKLSSLIFLVKVFLPQPNNFAASWRFP